MKKLFLFALAIFMVGFALATPPEPMAFYGEVTENGSAVPNMGYYITAKIDGNLNGECEIIDSEYGMGGNACVVVNHGSHNSVVDFFIGDVYLGEYDFNAREIVNLNFDVDELPSDFEILEDRECKVSEGECSYNVLYCHSSITDDCSMNGVCEEHLGETCSNNPEDCGDCPVEDNSGETSSSSSSSGGGGGSSGGGSSSTTTNSNDETETKNTEDLNLGVETNENDDSNESSENTDSEENKGRSFFSFLTGWATESGQGIDSEDAKLKNWVKWVGVIIVLGIIGFFLFNKAKDNNSKE